MTPVLQMIRLKLMMTRINVTFILGAAFVKKESKCRFFVKNAQLEWINTVVMTTTLILNCHWRWTESPNLTRSNMRVSSLCNDSEVVPRIRRTWSFAKNGFVCHSIFNPIDRRINVNAALSVVNANSQQTNTAATTSYSKRPQDVSFSRSKSNKLIYI